MPQHVQVTRSFFPFWLLAYVGFLLCCALEPSRCLQQLRDALQNGQGEKWEFCWRTGQLSDKRLLQVAMPVAMQWGCSCRGRQWGIAPLCLSSWVSEWFCSALFFCWFFLFFSPKKTDIRWWGRVQFLLQNVFLLKSKQKQNEICFDRRGGGNIGRLHTLWFNSW